MDPTVAALVLMSAALHPLWNAMIKRDRRPEGAFMALFFGMSLSALAHALIAGEDIFGIFRHWPLLALSWFGQMFYGVGLTVALKRGDLSSYYPIIRSSPLFIVLVGWTVLGERYSATLLIGIAMVLVGAFLLQRRPGQRLLDDPVTLGFAIAAMAGVGIYSIADAKLMAVADPSVTIFWIQLMTLPGFTVIFRFLGGSKTFDHVWSWTDAPWKPLVFGGLAYASYFLILTAYKMGGDVAAVTSVRQASIPFSVLIGGLWLKESRMSSRLGASLLLAAGIVVIVTLK